MKDDDRQDHDQPRMRRLEPFDVDLAVRLTTDERLNAGEALGRCHEKLDDLDRQLSQAKSANKAAREPVEADVKHLAGCLRTGEETRPTRCQWVLDFDSNLAALIRLDTSQVVRERPLTEKERQASLPIGD